jgi:hypothetical protein
MVLEPHPKRAIAFVDGQNLFHMAKLAFGCRVPDYNPQRLALSVCQRMGWQHVGTYFYTGVPDQESAPFWHGFWASKLARMQDAGVVTFQRPLAYRVHWVRGGDGIWVRSRVGQEKGVDVRMALDVVRLAREGAFDVALLFTQDQDFVEVALEVRRVAQARHSWLKVASAFPEGRGSGRPRGVDRTDWVPIRWSEYRECRDFTAGSDPVPEDV